MVTFHNGFPDTKLGMKALRDLLSEAFGAEYLHNYELQFELWQEYEPEAAFYYSESQIPIAYLLAATYRGSHNGGKYAYLYCVCTSKKWRGRGQMTMLLQKVRMELKKKGYMGVFLVPSNDSIVPFYKARGFRQMDTPAFSIVPKDGRPALIPASVAQNYIIDSGEYEAYSGGEIMPLPSGWMFSSFSENEADDPCDFSLVWPLP